jgi:hypothetical protein
MGSFTRSGGLAATLSAVMLAGTFSIAVAAPPDGGGGSDTGDVFADLNVILRDVDGVPILTASRSTPRRSTPRSTGPS